MTQTSVRATVTSAGAPWAVLLACLPGLAGAQRTDSLRVRPDSQAVDSADVRPGGQVADSLQRDAAQQVADSAAIPGAQPTGVSPRTNPFAEFETVYLSNGLKVWFKRLEGAPNVSIGVAVPYGSDRDPEGKEQLAHFTEHMLFSDHDGRSEEDIKDAVEGQGGRRNGITSSDHTFYYVTIGREHGLFAIEWLSRIMSPHAMQVEVVGRNRQPVAVEINAKPREFFEHLFAALNPAFLRTPGFWEREFGMKVRTSFYDRWASLQRITPEDLQGFYDRYYTPGAMTLTVVGDLDRDEVLDLAERTFGTLPERPVAPLGYETEDPGRQRATYAWGFDSDIRYNTQYKFFNHTAEDELKILFIRDLLSRRLNQRLRFGERKAVYGLSVALTKRGPAAYLRLAGDVNEDEYDFALQVLDEELEQLRTGSSVRAEFEEDRRAVIERLRTANLTAESLNFWARRNFYDPNVFTDFPDVLGFYERVTQEEVAAFASQKLVADRQIISIIYLQPISQGVAVLAVILLVLLSHRVVSWVLTRSIEMKKIRYIARFRTPLLLRVGRVLVFGGLGLVLARFVSWGVERIDSTWVETVDNYAVQATSYSLMVSGMIALVILYLALFPRKLLVFPDHIRVKSRAYRSRVFKSEDIAEISVRRFHHVWLSRDLFGCTALTFGILRPGLYLRPHKGRALFFRTRDTKELTEVLGEWRGEPIPVGRAGAATTAAAATPAIAAAPARSDRKAAAPKPATPKLATSKPAAAPSSPPPARPPQADPSPEATADEDVDYDSVGLTEEEMRELLGE